MNQELETVAECDGACTTTWFWRWISGSVSVMQLAFSFACHTGWCNSENRRHPCSSVASQHRWNHILAIPGNSFLSIIFGMKKNEAGKGELMFCQQFSLNMLNFFWELKWNENGTLVIWFLHSLSFWLLIDETLGTMETSLSDVGEVPLMNFELFFLVNCFIITFGNGGWEFSWKLPVT